MGLLAVLGLILIVVGILALLSVIAIGQTWAIILIVVGILLTVFFGRTYVIR